jgi:DNA-binding NarL/FixJ family response regulator
MVFSAIRQIAGGEAIIPSQTAAQLIYEFRYHYSLDIEMKPDEVRIMNMIGDGLSSAEVAYRGLIPESEVNRILSRFISILQTELRAEAEDMGRRFASGQQ